MNRHDAKFGSSEAADQFMHMARGSYVLRIGTKPELNTGASLKRTQISVTMGAIASDASLDTLINTFSEQPMLLATNAVILSSCVGDDTKYMPDHFTDATSAIIKRGRNVYMKIINPVFSPEDVYDNVASLASNPQAKNMFTTTNYTNVGGIKINMFSAVTNALKTSAGLDLSKHATNRLIRNMYIRAFKEISPSKKR